VQATLKTYYRLTKPGIIYGNTLSVIAGFLLASQGHINLLLFLATLVGIALLMAAGCVYNNWLDRSIDARMARTKKRALVTGSVQGWQAITYASVLAVLGFAILVVFTNRLTVVLGVIAIVMYVLVYGFAKRRSSLGTIVGSVAGALPPAAGYTAVTGHFDGGAWLLFLVLTLWQMPHFYAIAIYRLKDYAAAGIPVLPAVRGNTRTKLSIMVYIVAYTAAASLLAVFGYASYAYLAVVLLLGVAWFGRGLQMYKTANDIQWARKMFFLSLIVLLVWAITVSVDSFF
jgi:protoheme IX farnesyltransferase